MLIELMDRFKKEHWESKNEILLSQEEIIRYLKELQPEEFIPAWQRGSFFYKGKRIYVKPN